ncbi:MAG: hypothetical protein ACRCT1_00735 [Microcoleaceae cyanobacterium]
MTNCHDRVSVALGYVTIAGFPCVGFRVYRDRWFCHCANISVGAKHSGR